jgi:NADPH:quinone reductase-like Zn-dependent oxidoreductase
VAFSLTKGQWLSDQRHPPECHNGAPDTLAGRLLLDWEPSDRLKVELNVNGWRDRTEPTAAQYVAFIPTFAPVAVGRRCSARPGSPPIARCSRSRACRAGQTVLVQGASGGVASALIQIGRAAGYRVWVTGRSAEKRALAERLGAHATFGSNEPLPAPVDVVFDPVGKATWAHSLASVRTGGTIVVCGIPSGNLPELDIARVFIDQIVIRGVYAGTLGEFRDMLSFITAAEIEPYVGATMPLADAREAFRMMIAGDTPAKIVLTI